MYVHLQFDVYENPQLLALKSYQTFILYPFLVMSSQAKMAGMFSLLNATYLTVMMENQQTNCLLHAYKLISSVWSLYDAHNDF